MLINNRYQVIRTLGEGGFGHAYLAKDTQMPSGRQCVIKQLKPQATGTASSEVYKVVQERFAREAAILEQVGEHHPQIPRLYAYFSENAKFYLVQEWIEGTTLEAILTSQGPQSEEKVRSLLNSLLPVLDFIHQQGLIHRDLKPENIILRSDSSHPDGLGQPVLIDFGAVRETMGTMMNSHNSLTSTIVIGTPGYMPSEQAAGRPLPSSDLYSLGLTVIYALTGRSPQALSSDPQSGEVLWKEAAGHVSPELVQVIDKAVRSHPRDRYSSAQQMLSALTSMPIAADVPVTTAPVVTAPKTVAAAPAPTTANQFGASTNQQPSVTEQSFNPSLNSPEPTFVASNTSPNFPSKKSISPAVIGLIAAAVGVSAIGGGLLVSRFAGDSSLRTAVDPVSSTELSNPAKENSGKVEGQKTASSADTEANSPKQPGRSRENEANVPGQDTRQSQSSQPVAAQNSAESLAQSPQLESAVTPDNPDAPTFGQSVVFREDLGGRVDVFESPGGAGEPLHYGLPGDRVTLLDQVNRPSGVWNLVRFPSGAEGWVRQNIIAWDLAPSVQNAPQSAGSQSEGNQLPAYGWLRGIAPGNQVDIYPTPMFDPGPEHYGLVGDRVSILDSAKGYGDGLTWYRVEFASGATGWVRNDFIALP